jgi:hypothetical protein
MDFHHSINIGAFDNYTTSYTKVYADTAALSSAGMFFMNGNGIPSGAIQVFFLVRAPVWVLLCAFCLRERSRSDASSSVSSRFAKWNRM